ncbi:Cellulose synthase-like protein E1 [Sesamum angolense]|uniref:Cellulose synthase-like protein E1 n=1 Tax=Sesamum angolense TaxID=2727404 RepID=A0AAE1X6S2_9LAMI|nr:Cellulose synthase-like protein E1 [Sesamum angolense]
MTTKNRDSLSEENSDDRFISCSQFLAEEKEIEKKYNEFEESLEKNSVNASSSASRDHAPIIEAMNDAVDSSQQEMPILVYIAPEKRPSCPHYFKAGALNALIRVSAVISNAPYILVLDCDHYCNDPTSARQAMCYYLDPEISPKLAFIQFPQKFHNLSGHDLYDNRLNYYWRRWLGFDGLGGPSISGCNLYLKREALYGTKNIKNDLNHLKKSFGSSNELIRSISKNYKLHLSKDRKLTDSQANEVGFIYFSVVEDVITGEYLHCQGWISVLVDPPSRPCFLGSCPTNPSDTLVQQGRWALGLMQISVSKYCALLYGRGRMSTLHSMCYAALSIDPIYVVPFYVLAIVPQICLLRGIPLYPKVSDPFFIVFAFVFFASQLKHVQEVLSYGDSLMSSLYELRMWTMRSASSYFLYIVSVVSLVVGMARIVQTKSGGEMLAQAFIPLLGVIVNYQVFEGMVLRKDRGRIAPSVSVLSAAIATFVLCFGSLVFIY